MAKVIINKFNQGIYALAVNDAHLAYFPESQYEHYEVSQSVYDDIKHNISTLDASKSVVPVTYVESEFDTLDRYEGARVNAIAMIEEFLSQKSNDSRMTFITDLTTYLNTLKSTSFDGVSFPQGKTFEKYMADSGATVFCHLHLK
jgi:hypothetical protein